jgi:hypothetical protein
VGDVLAFSVSFYNPLAIPLVFDVISLTASNAIAHPISHRLPKLTWACLSLTIAAAGPGVLSVTGFKFIAGNLTGIFRMETPINLDVLEKLPTIVVKRPPRADTAPIENSTVRLEYELMNPSDVTVAIRGMTFGPMPAVLTSSSLPIAYPPTVDPPIPQSLAPGEVKPFTLSWLTDKTISTLSWAIEYGTDEFSRRFEANQQFDIAEGPHVSRVQVISLDDHDDFDTNSVTLMVIVLNPLEAPIAIWCGSESPVMVEPQSLGTFMIGVDRIEIRIDPNTKKVLIEDVSADHVRKCEAVAVIEKNAKLTYPEKVRVASVLLLKQSLQKKLTLTWAMHTGLSGSLPFTHVPVDDDTLVLLKPPPFKVELKIEKMATNIWNLICRIDSETEMIVKVKFSFELENNPRETNCILIAGAEETSVQVPASITTSIHCLPVGPLIVIGRFFVGNAYFVRRGKFQLD